MIYCCKDCTKRCLGCHSTCEGYIAQKAEHDERRLHEHHENRVISLNSNGTYYSGKHSSGKGKRR